MGKKERGAKHQNLCKQDVTCLWLTPPCISDCLVISYKTCQVLNNFWRKNKNLSLTKLTNPRSKSKVQVQTDDWVFIKI